MNGKEAMSQMIELTETGFATEVLRANEPVLVDFYAPWCGPCKMLAPMLDTLAAEFAGRIKFAKLNVDEAPGLAGQFQITGVPTLLLFQHGQVVDQMVGLASPAALRSRLQQVLEPVSAT